MKRLSEQPNFKGGFLSPKEDNIEDLTQSIQIFFDAVQDTSDSGRRSRDVDNYISVLGKAEFPLNGQPREEVAAMLNEMFGGVPRVHHPNSGFNIIPSPFFDGVSARVLTSIFRPNAATDRNSGNGIATEQWVVTALGRGMFQTDNSAGFSTSGGASTLLYGIKCGLSKVFPEHKTKGICGNNFAVISSDRAHFSLETTVDYLGMGTESWHKVRTLSDGSMNLDAFEQKINEQLQAGNKIAAIIATCGTSVDFCIDDIKGIRKICDKYEKKYKLENKIHIHADAVSGWAWLFTNDNAILGNDVTSERIRQTKDKLRAIKYADTTGVDFHKTFIAPYVTSFFIGRDLETISGLGNPDKNPFQAQTDQVQMYHMTIENSRPLDGVATAYTLMKRLGREGITEYIRSRLNVRSKIEQLMEGEFSKNFTILNGHSGGFEVIFTASNDYGDQFEKSDYQALVNMMLDGGDDIPMIGFIPEYLNQSTGEIEPALMIYPMSPHADTNSCRHLLSRISTLVNIIDPGQNGHLENDYIPMR